MNLINFGFLYELFNKIFTPLEPSERMVIKLFNFWHLFYLCFIFIAVVVLTVCFKDKDEKTKEKISRIPAYIMLIGYIADFFVQPFYAGGLCVNMLPFHICTAMAIIIAFITFKKVKWMYTPVTVISLFAGIAFIMFPGTYLNGSYHPFTYRIIQTFLYHGTMVFWGVWMIASKKAEFNFKEFYRPIVVLGFMAIWATIGNQMFYPDFDPITDTGYGENFMFLRKDLLFGISYPYHLILYLFLLVVLCVVFYCAMDFKNVKEMIKAKKDNRQYSH